VIILTSRSNKPEVIDISLAEIKKANIHFTDYYFLPEMSARPDSDFPQELNWFEKHIWQKAEYCKKKQDQHFL